MAFKVKVVPIGPSNTTIFQMAAGSEGAIHGLVFCNNNAESRTLTVKLLDGSESTTSVIVVKVMEPNSQYTWPKPINMESGDALIATGADLIALHSTYVGTATPATQGFTGRGTWSNVALYDPNDVVNYEGSSYLANAANTGSTPPSADWTLLSAKGDAGIPSGEIRTPTAVSPTTGGLNIPPNGPLQASPYAPLYSADVRNYREFQVATTADTTFASPVFSVQVNADSTFISPILSVGTGYRWRCKDVAVSGAESDWMTTQTFTTLSLFVVTPTVTVEGAPTFVGRSPFISTSAYQTSPTDSATHLSTSWEVRLASDDSLVFSSYNDTVNLTTIQVPFDVLTTSTQYVFKAKHISTLYGESAFGTQTATTLSSFVNQNYSPVVISDDRRYNLSLDKSVVSINDDSFVVAYQETGTTSFSATTLNTSTITIEIWNRVGGVFTKDNASTTVVATDAAGTFASWSIEMVTPTLGVVVYRDRASDTTGAAAARAFQITGGSTITLGNKTQIAPASSNAMRGFAVKRLTDTLVVAGFFNGLTPQFYGLVLSNVGIAVGAFGAGTASIADDGNLTVDIDKITDTTFIAATRNWDGVSTFASRVAAGTVGASTGNVTMGTPGSQITASPAQAGIRVVTLTPTIALLASRSSTAVQFSQITITGTTLAGVRPLTSASTVGFNFNNRDTLVRISDTTALATFDGTSCRVITATGTATTEGVVQALQPQVADVGNFIRISDSAGVARFEYFGQLPESTFQSQITHIDGFVTSTTVQNLNSKTVGTQYTTLIKKDSIAMLSNTRAVVMERDGGFASGATSPGRVELSMWNIAPNVPTLVNKTVADVSALLTVGQSSLCALSFNRVLVVAGPDVHLFSASDSGFTLLSTATLSTFGADTTSSTSTVMISETSALVFFKNASGGVSGQFVTTTSDTISLASAFSISAQTTVRGIAATALSPTRVLVAFNKSAVTASDLVSLVGLVGGVWGGVDLDKLIASSALPGPPTISTLDSTRAVFGHQPTATTGALRVISAASDLITVGNPTTTAVPVSNTTGQSVAAVSLDGVNCIAAVQVTAGTKLYSFTVGSGTATPSTPVAMADLNTNTIQSNPAIRCFVFAPPTAGATPSAMIITQERDAGLSQSHNVLMRKFLRGTA